MQPTVPTSPTSLNVDLVTILNAAGYLIVIIAAWIVQRKQSKKESVDEADNLNQDDLVEKLAEEMQERIKLENEIDSLKNDRRVLTKLHPIVYINSDPVSGLQVSQQLNKAGIQNKVKWIYTTELAYSFMKENEILIAIIDEKTDLIGKRVIEIMKNDEKLRDIHIVFLSESEDDISIYRDGVICSIKKPFNISQLLYCLAKHGFYWSLSKEK